MTGVGRDLILAMVALLAAGCGTGATPGRGQVDAAPEAAPADAPGDGSTLDAAATPDASLAPDAFDASLEAAPVDAPAPDTRGSGSEDLRGPDGVLPACLPGNTCPDDGCCLYQRCVPAGDRCSRAGDIVYDNRVCQQAGCSAPDGGSSCGREGEFCCFNLIGTSFCTQTATTCGQDTRCVPCGRPEEPCCVPYKFRPPEEGTCLASACTGGRCASP